MRSAAWVAVACLALLPRPAASQALVYEKTIDAPPAPLTAEWAYSVRSTQDGGSIVAGFTATGFLPLEDDFFLVKTNAAGDTLWTRTFGGPGDDGARTVVEIAGGGFAALGYTQSFGAGGSDLYLVRTDAQGQPLWQRTYGGSRNDLGEGMCAMPDGGFLLVGSTASFGAGDYDAYLVRTNAVGDTLWTRTYGGTDLDGGTDARPAPGGGAILSGYTASSGVGFLDAWLVRVDAAGHTLWSRTYGGPDEDWGSSVAPTADGGWFVAGTRDAAVGAGFSGRLWALRVDAVGDTLWTRAFGKVGVEDANGEAGQQAADGGYILAGSQNSAATGVDVLVVRLNAAGKPRWLRRLDRHGGTEHGADVAQGADGDFVVTGYTDDLATWYDVYLAKLRDGPVTSTSSDTPSAWTVRAHPNPFTSVATFEIDAGSARAVGRCEFRLYDAAGRCVRSAAVAPPRFHVERGALAPGMYFYEIRPARGEAARGKLGVR